MSTLRRRLPNELVDELVSCFPLAQFFDDQKYVQLTATTNGPFGVYVAETRKKILEAVFLFLWLSCLYGKTSNICLGQG